MKGHWDCQALIIQRSIKETERVETALKGNLKETSLPKLLVRINRERLTGTLKVSTDLFEKKLYFISGDLIFASSNYEDDRLGEFLLKIGKINIQQYEKSVELLKKTGKRQGAIMVELGYLTPKELFWSVKQQVQEIVFSLFQLEEGEFQFLEGEIPSEEVITLKISLGDLLYQGVKRIDNWTRIQREMPPLERVLRISNDRASLFQEINLPKDDREVLSLVDGKRTIRDILGASSQGSFPALKTLYVLYSIGILEEATDAEHTETSAEAIAGSESSGPDKDEEREVPEEIRGFYEEVQGLYERLSSLSAHELLGITSDSPFEEAKKQYYRLAKKYHPDRYVKYQVPELNRMLTDLFDAITKAYDSIKDGKPYAREVEPVKEEEKPVEVPPEVQALRQYKRALKELRAGDFWVAAEALRWATRLDPKEPKYWFYLSKALSNIPKRLKHAEEALLEAIKLDRFNPEYYAELGQIYLKGGMKKRARRQFQKALELDSKNSTALEGLKATEE